MTAIFSAVTTIAAVANHAVTHAAIATTGAMMTAVKGTKKAAYQQPFFMEKYIFLCT